jgi:hypothetical protein
MLPACWTGALEPHRTLLPGLRRHDPGSYRLVMVDFAQHHKPAVFPSLLIYGGALMALPRLARTLVVSRGNAPR